MPSAIDVHLDGMAFTAQDIRTYATNMQQELDGLTASLNVLASQWSGEAHDAYREAQMKWNELMGASTQTLNSAASQIDAAIDAYKEAEAAVIRECGGQ